MNLSSYRLTCMHAYRYSYKDKCVSSSFEEKKGNKLGHRELVPNPHSKGIWLCEVWNLDQCGRAWLTNSFYKKVGFWGRERGFPRRACQYFAILWWGWGVYKYFWRVIKTTKTWWRQRVVMELPYLVYYYGLKLITKSFKISKIFSWIILNYFNNLFFFQLKTWFDTGF